MWQFHQIQISPIFTPGDKGRKKDKKTLFLTMKLPGHCRSSTELDCTEGRCWKTLKLADRSCSALILAGRLDTEGVTVTDAAGCTVGDVRASITRPCASDRNPTAIWP